MNDIPVLMLMFNRLEYSIQALEALKKCRGADIYIIDDGSTDGTLQWLANEFKAGKIERFASNPENLGIAASMNRFLEWTKYSKYVAKVDCDTLVKPDFLEKMIPHLSKADMVQAKHPLIKASKVG